MKSADILKSLRDQKSKAVEGLTDQAAERLIKATLGEVRNAIEAMPEGSVGFNMLGRFMVKQIEKESEAGKTVVRRVLFKAAAPKPAGEAADNQAKGNKGKGKKTQEGS